MFKLVGKETFSVGNSDTKATINIDAVSGFAYEYTLEINGKSLKKYMENRSKVTSTWLLNLDGMDYRVVLGEATSFTSHFGFYIANQSKSLIERMAMQKVWQLYLCPDIVVFK